MRSKREKRLRAIRRDMVQPIYDKKDAAKQAALEAALAAPKLPVKPSSSSAAMETENNDTIGISPYYLWLTVHFHLSMIL